MKFNSAICTTKEQSERLIALGLKKETADMIYIPKYNYDFTEFIGYYHPQVIFSEYCQKSERYNNLYIPAWSLDRLRELYKCVGDTSLWNLDDVNYDRLIQCIGLAIKHNSFNKEYLEE